MWIHYCKLYESKFQAGCLAKRMEEDYWIYGYHKPSEVQVFETRKKKYGVKYRLEEEEQTGNGVVFSDSDYPH